MDIGLGTEFCRAAAYVEYHFILMGLLIKKKKFNRIIFDV